MRNVEENEDRPLIKCHQSRGITEQINGILLLRIFMLLNLFIELSFRSHLCYAMLAEHANGAVRAHQYLLQIRNRRERVPQSEHLGHSRHL